MAKTQGRHSVPPDPNTQHNSSLRPSSRQSTNTSPGANPNAYKPYVVKRSRFAHKQAAKQFASYDTSAIRPRRRKWPIIIAVVLFLGVAAALVYGGIELYDMFLGTPEAIEPGITVTVRIDEGDATSVIATKLKEKGVIAETRAFTSRVVERAVSDKLRPGLYTLTTGMDIDELIDRLVEGPIVQPDGNKLTIPEGLTAQETADRVEEICGIPAATFMEQVYAADQYVSDYPFLEGVYDNSLEGFLYPKTYIIPEEATASDVIRVLLDQFEIEFTAVNMQYAEEHNLTVFDVVTIGSLVERETAEDEERPLVSSVIHNRLREGMRLQLDPTVNYALRETNDPKQSPSFEDLEVDSPYNTYKVDGLPAGPICSPRIESLIAAANPADTGYYYYALSSPDSTKHIFSETLEEHNIVSDAYNEAAGIE
ncbi:MAG: endolytic transglycosylase MltG [Coriobacteriales bacterium]|jgi:UPF0755 protein|nr:endolytic transglycosylase MltG [Coriobacteriales bacterium]